MIVHAEGTRLGKRSQLAPKWLRAWQTDGGWSCGPGSSIHGIA